MLTELLIRNFVIIEEQQISFSSGLNVISGETGAGKSIILQALNLILGARPKNSLLRKGADQWEIQALFDLSDYPESFKVQLPDIAQTNELVLYRSMNEQGRGKVYVNGSLATVAILEEIANHLINICGQGQQIALLNPVYHQELLDSYGDYAELLESYKKTYQEWRALVTNINNLTAKKEERSLKKAQLEFIVTELSELELLPDMRVQLESSISKLSKAEDLLQHGQSLQQILTGDSGIQEQVLDLAKTINAMKKIDSRFACLDPNLDALHEIIANIDSEQQKLFMDVELNDELLETQRDQLSQLARLERKYSLSSDGLLELLNRSNEALDKFKEGDNIQELEAELKIKADVLSKIAANLAQQRKKTGADLAKKIQTELAELNMKSIVFVLSQERTDFTPTGFEKLEFLISTNKGEDLKPLKQVASGGELSRIMLVLKKILKERSGVNVLVFDEVDTGISGKVARAVGEKLKALAQNSQVLCITHLAQVASLADQHYLVSKSEGSRSTTSVERLTGERQVEEIARMLAGHEVTESSRETARELLAS